MGVLKRIVQSGSPERPALAGPEAKGIQFIARGIVFDVEVYADKVVIRSRFAFNTMREIPMREIESVEMGSPSFWNNGRLKLVLEHPVGWWDTFMWGKRDDVDFRPQALEEFVRAKEVIERLAKLARA